VGLYTFDVPFSTCQIMRSHVSAFPSLLYSRLSIFIALYIIYNTKNGSCVYVSDTFESCGIFLQDSQTKSVEQGDVVHEILEHLHLKWKRPQSLIIQNELSKKEIHPNIFRSMKYECYLYIHINFGKELFSTIPVIENPLQSALYQKAIFLIFVKSHPDDMFTGKSWNSQLERQNRIFVFQIKINLGNYELKSTPFYLRRTYFFCTFCKHGLVDLNSSSTNSLSLKLSSFEKKWVPKFAEHYFYFGDEEDLARDEACIKADIMELHNFNREPKCDSPPMLARLIIFASGSNLTLKLRRDTSEIPRMSLMTNQQGLRFEKHKYSSPILRKHNYPSIIYCFNLEKGTVAQTNMWTKYVALDSWALVGLFLIVLSILNANKGSTIDRKSIKLIMANLFLLVNSFLKITRVISRQSWSHKWKLFGLVELIFSTLISVYENSITAGVVVPSVPEPFSNTRELFNNNYTFVVEKESSSGIYGWLSDEYNTKNHRRVTSVEDFAYVNTWLKKYFLETSTDKKYAIVGQLSKNYHFRAITFAKEKNHTCYQMYPTEKAFMAQSIYFQFRSAMASSLQKGVLLLQAFGFTHAFETTIDHLGYSVALDYTRRLAAQYGYTGITSNHLKNERLQENMITFGNLKPILVLQLLLNFAAGVFLITELLANK